MPRLLDSEKKREIWNKLKTVALSDGVFTTEEQQLMAHIILDLEHYTEMIQKALNDNVIDYFEEKELFEGRMQIMEKAYEKAREDETLTEDEQNILKAICHVIIEMED